MTDKISKDVLEAGEPVPDDEENLSNNGDASTTVGDPFVEATTALAVNKQPLPISVLYKKYKTLPLNVLQLYQDIADSLFAKTALGKRDQAFLEDYVKSFRESMTQNCARLERKVAEETAKRPLPEHPDIEQTPETSRRILDDPRYETLHAKSSGGDKVPPLELNKLFLKPQNFNGETKNAREWIEDYELVAQTNSWSKAQMARYFPSFLTESARTWYLTWVMRKTGPNPSWEELRKVYTQFYLGTSDVFALQRQIDDAYQKESESIVQFIPRMLKLVELLDPNKAEEQVVHLIKSKLRSYYQRSLAAFYINSLDELTEICLRLEGCATSTRTAASREKADHEKKTKKTEPKKIGAVGKDRPATTASNRDAGKATAIDKSDIKCYACDRMGHYSNECSFKTKENGFPLNKKKEKNINAIDEAPAEPAEPDGPGPAATGVVTIRSPGHFLGMIMACDKKPDGLLRQTVSINGRSIEAIVDTGARLSVISGDLARNQQWPLKESNVQLIGASGNQLECLGQVAATVMLALDNAKKTVQLDIPVIENLYFNVLIGMDLLRALTVSIHVRAERPLRFERSAAKTGLRVEERTILAPRTLNLVQVRVNSEASAIVARPFHIDGALLVANSVSPVSANRSVVLVANIDIQAIELKTDVQIASFEDFIETEKRENNPMLMTELIELVKNGETVKVGKELNSLQLKELEELLKGHLTAFSINGALGSTRLVEHRIEVLPNTKPVAMPLRRRPELHIDEAARQVAEMLKSGVIERSYSPWAAAYVIVRKKTGEFRFCVDFRGLNAVTRKDSYPLPHVDRCIEQVAGNKFYSLLDFASGYWQIPVSEESKDLTSFRTESGLWRFRKMPFGLCTAPASFQRLMNGLFAGLAGPQLQVFIDDLCLATRTWPEHLALLDQVLTTIEKQGLKLKASKCTFGASEIIFLGHKISADGIRTDPAKIRALIGLESPRDVRGVRRVVGMLSYYRKFIPNFAILAEPLIRLTRKNREFQWNLDHERAFRKLIDELTRNATLVNMTPNDPVLLKTDASKAGVAGMLFQSRQGVWRLVSCCSRRLSSAEQNYAITELEALAIVYAVCRFRHYLLGRFFRIVTDHHALCSLTAKPQQGRLQRWALLLSEFHYEVVYARGAAHTDVDCLSRAPVDDSDPYTEQVMTICRPIEEKAWLAAYDDDESQQLKEKAENEYDQFRLAGGIIYFRDKLFVPRRQRQRILNESHDQAGHDGIENTLNRMTHLWWPKLTADVKEYVSSCDVCQRRKAERAKPAGQMMPHLASRPMEKWCFDYIGPLPETISRRRFIIVGVDVFCRFIQAKAVKDQTATRFLAFFRQLCTTFGWPQTVVTDNAKAFDNRELKALERTMHIRHVFSAPRHHTGNAPAERAIQKLNEKLAMNMQQETTQEWDILLPTTVASLNTAICKSTRRSPFELMFGRTPSPAQLSLQEVTEVLDLDHEKERIEQIRQAADNQQQLSHQRAKYYFDAQHRQRELEVGDLVLLERSDRRKKLSDKYEGPYQIMSRANDLYTVQHQERNETRIKHISQMKPYKQRIVPALATLLLLATCFISGQARLNALNAAHWVKVDDRYVSPGQTTAMTDIVFVNPCALLERFHRAKTLNPSQFRIQTPWVVNPGHQAPEPRSSLKQEQQRLGQHLKQNNVLPPINPTMNNVQVAVDHCNAVWGTFVASLERLNVKTEPLVVDREKRQVAVAAAAGAAGYMYLSNLFSSHREPVHHDTLSDDDRWDLMQKKISNLNDQENLQKIFNQITRTELHQISTMLGQLGDNVNYLITVEPEISAVLCVMINRIQNRKELADRLYTSIKLEATDMIAIGQLISPEVYRHLHPSDATVTQIQFFSRDSLLRIVIQGRTRSMDTEVYQVHALHYVTREKNVYYEHTYTGNQWLIRNRTSDCVRAIEPSVSRFIRTSCTQAHFRDSKLRQWNRRVVTPQEASPADEYEAWPDVVVQCWPKNLTIFHPIAKTLKCPMQPIALNATWSFETSDHAVKHSGVVNAKLSSKLVELDFLVADVHHDVGSLDIDGEQQREFEAILEEKKNLSRQFIALEVQGTPISYKHTTVGLGAIIGCVVCGYAINRAWRTVVTVKRCVNALLVPSRIVRPEEMSTYASQLRRLSQRKNPSADCEPISFSKGGDVRRAQDTPT